MDYEGLKNRIYNYNEDEQFYREYYYARQQEYSLHEFLAKINKNQVYRHHLLVPEIKDTIPPRFEDSFFFPDPKDTIITLRHNRFTPALIHEHTFFEIIYIYDGHCQQTISNKSLDLQTGDVCIVPPGIRHSIGVFDDSVVLNVLVRKSTLHNIFFNFLNTSNILTAFFLNNIYAENGNDYVVFHTGNDTFVKDGFFHTLLESTNRNLYWCDMVSHTIMIIFGLLIRNYEKNVDVPVFTQKIDVQRFALLQYIQENYATVTLDQIAAKFHYTPEHTSRLIKATTGRTYTEILQQVRLEKAQILLQDTNLTVTDIALQIGYDTAEHFIRMFKKRMGFTPTEYRRKGIII